ncbi:MAG: hypothetical protein MHM6MM_002643 [Cercozoa sp. M6MM]
MLSRVNRVFSRRVRAFAIVPIETPEALQEQLSQQDKVVVIDWFADWCGPCQMMRPFYEQLSEKHNDAVFLAVDADKMQGVAQQLGVTALPTFHVVKNNEMLSKVEGANESGLSNAVEEALKAE